MENTEIKVLIFDTFGTVVDWHSTIVEEGTALGSKYNINMDWHSFANKWRFGYFEATREIAKGNKEWKKIDLVFRDILDELLVEYDISDVIPQEEIEHFATVWHRLKVWPDTLEGLKRLKEKYLIGPFSNGDFKLILDMAKYADLGWDFITTADMFKKFKPDPSIYKDVVQFLDVKPEEVMMVAAHPFDLDGAVEAGCRTAYVTRELEFGESSDYVEPKGKYENDIMATDFVSLAERLNA